MQHLDSTTETLHRCSRASTVLNPFSICTTEHINLDAISLNLWWLETPSDSQFTSQVEPHPHDRLHRTFPEKTNFIFSLAHLVELFWSIGVNPNQENCGKPGYTHVIQANTKKFMSSGASGTSGGPWKQGPEQKGARDGSKHLGAWRVPCHLQGWHTSSFFFMHSMRMMNRCWAWVRVYVKVFCIVTNSWSLKDSLISLQWKPRSVSSIQLLFSLCVSVCVLL